MWLRGAELEGMVKKQIHLWIILSEASKLLKKGMRNVHRLDGCGLLNKWLKV
uniref:Uncharacterized protein n=1 Tax=Moumouvirus sp. 'Monve' TaxID=1128131 RepID=H2EFU7_9VIRU|nr:hypothetical protein mv_R797 [Moumouvirus Monve]